MCKACRTAVKASSASLEPHGEFVRTYMEGCCVCVPEWKGVRTYMEAYVSVCVCVYIPECKGVCMCACS